MISRRAWTSQSWYFGELWVSLASLLRSYTAAHGLNGNRQATVELGEEQITVRHGNAWMELDRGAVPRFHGSAKMDKPAYWSCRKPADCEIRHTRPRKKWIW